MAYLFQGGPTARLSGAVEQEGNISVSGSGNHSIGVEAAFGTGQFLASLGFDGTTQTGKLDIADASTGGTAFHVHDKLSGSVMNTLAGAALDFDQSTGVMDVTNSGVAGLISEAAITVNADSIVYYDASGVLQRDTLVDYASALAAGNGIDAAAGSLFLDLDELVAGAIDVAADEFAFVDTSTGANSTRKESIADLMTAVAGNGLGASSGVLSLDLHELTAVQIASGDFLPLVDSTDNSTKKETIDDIATLFAGAGLGASSAVMEVEVSGALKVGSGITGKVGISGSIAGAGLSHAGGVDSISSLAVDSTELASVFSAGTIDVNADKFIFIDDNASDEMKSVTMSAYATAIAGVGIDASSGVLALDVNELSQAAIADGDFIVMEDATDNSTKKEAIADIATLFAGYGLSAASSVMALDLNELTQEAIASGDFISFVDSTDNGTHKESIDDIATLFAGDGLAASSAVLAVQVSGAVKIASDHVGITGSIAGDGLTFAGGADSISELSLDLNELTAGAVADGDFFTFIDTGSGNVTRKDAIHDLATLFAGAGTLATSSVINIVNASNGGLNVGANNVALDLNDLAAASVDVGADSIAIIDGTDNSTKKESIEDLVTAMAGAGLAASSGVLSVQSNNITDFTTNHTAVEGFNYADADFSSDVTVTLPASPTVGDVVRIKARNLTNDANIIIAAAGSHKIDINETQIRIESPFGAVSCVYVEANDWRIF